MVQFSFAAGVPSEIKDGTQKAVDEWNEAMPWSPEGGNVEFCQRSGDSTLLSNGTICPEPASPTRSVDDGRTVTIKVIDGTVPNADECNKPKSFACVIDDDSMGVPLGDAIGNQTMYIKSPAVAYGAGLDGSPRTVIWTLDEHDHERTMYDPDRRELVLRLYLPGVIMHELGHAAGLGELRDQPEHSESVMHYSYDTYKRKVTSIPDVDAEYLRYNQQQGESNQSGRIRRKVTR